MEELKPCPFCGGEATLYNDGVLKYIYCTNCGCRTTRFDWYDKKRMVQKWNRRASDADTSDKKEVV